MSGRWRWVSFGFSGLPHACPIELVDDLVRDMEARGATLDSVEPVAQFNIDYPGMVCMDRPWSSFVMDDITIDIPDEDVASFVLQLDELSERYFIEPAGGLREQPRGRPYYKLKGFHRAVVLTPDDKLCLRVVLSDGLAAAETSATAFYADRKLPSEILREANAVANNVPVEQVPDCGATRQDRFKSKTRGQS